MPKHELRNKIISTAETLLEESNYTDISIREISNSAGISIGAFYRHIESKEKLFEIFYQNLKDQIISSLKVEDSGDPGIKKLEMLFNIYIDLVLKYGYKCTAFFLLLPLEKKKIFSPSRVFYNFLEEHINEAMKYNIFNEKYNSGYILNALYSCARGAVFNWCGSRGTTDLKKDFLLTFSILINEFKK